MFVYTVQSNRRAKVYASLAEKGEYYSNRPPTPLLDTINYPIHMKNLSVKVKIKALIHMIQLSYKIMSQIDRIGGILYF